MAQNFDRFDEWLVKLFPANLFLALDVSTMKPTLNSSKFCLLILSFAHAHAPFIKVFSIKQNVQVILYFSPL